MTGRPLNLLRHPRRLPGWRSDWLRPVLLAGCAGALAGGAWGAWQHQRLDTLLAQQAHLQQRLQVQLEQQARVSAHQARQHLQQAQRVRAQDWQRQRQQLQALHAALAAQAPAAGLRVERWQGDGQKLLLQGWLPRAQAIPALLAQLSSAWPQPWQLHQLADRSAGVDPGGLDLVLEAPWSPAVQDKGQSRP